MKTAISRVLAMLFLTSAVSRLWGRRSDHHPCPPAAGRSPQLDDPVTWADLADQPPGYW